MMDSNYSYKRKYFNVFMYIYTYVYNNRDNRKFTNSKEMNISLQNEKWIKTEIKLEMKNSFRIE